MNNIVKVIFLTTAFYVRVRRWLFRRKLRAVKNPYMPDNRILSYLIKVRVRWEYSPLPHPAAVLLFIMALLFYFWKVNP